MTSDEDGSRRLIGEPVGSARDRVVRHAHRPAPGRGPAAVLPEGAARRVRRLCRRAREEARGGGRAAREGVVRWEHRWAPTGASASRISQTPGHYDMHARLRDLDNDGVAAEVMFHDSQNGEPIPFQTDTLLMRGAGVDQDFDLLQGRSAHLQPVARRRVLDRARAPHRADAPADVGHRRRDRGARVGAVGGAEGHELPGAEGRTSSRTTTRRGIRSSRRARTSASRSATTVARARAAAPTRARCRSRSTRSR